MPLGEAVFLNVFIYIKKKDDQSLDVVRQKNQHPSLVKE